MHLEPAVPQHGGEDHGLVGAQPRAHQEERALDEVQAHLLFLSRALHNQMQDCAADEGHYDPGMDYGRGQHPAGGREDHGEAGEHEPQRKRRGHHGGFFVGQAQCRDGPSESPAADRRLGDLAHKVEQHAYSQHLSWNGNPAVFQKTVLPALARRGGPAGAPKAGRHPAGPALPVLRLPVDESLDEKPSGYDKINTSDDAPGTVRYADSDERGHHRSQLIKCTIKNKGTTNIFSVALACDVIRCHIHQ
mmetsp:Transcript_102115/g.266480  ORF Transcript_102115/g.266480 Transcript_102115/m.266480 type:complete len:248 (-) Transcript_102115:399-1142(-)